MNLLIVGAGFSGAVIARQLAEAGHTITVIDKREHLAGNAYDFVNSIGIREHKYGPHLFHTSNKEVFDWLSRFTEWVEYKHKVKAQLADGRYVTLPVNKETQEIVGKENVLDIFFRPYTKKMWGVSLDELNPEIINRVPVRDDMNEYYFPNDEYQYLPKDGYTRLIQNILSHENIYVKLKCAFHKEMENNFDHIFNSMPIDEYFEFIHGNLPYRSIIFNTVHLNVIKALPTATVNFTHDGRYTRVTEWKNLPNHGTNEYQTTLTFEEPCDYFENNFERYYPIKDKDGINRALYERYKELTPSNVTFIGRCGLYAYLDIHQAVSSSFAIVRKFLS